MRRNKSIFQKIVESKTIECNIIKRILSAAVGFLVGYAYHKVSFAHAFTYDERKYSTMIKYGVLITSAVGSFLSPQCCCIAALCIPTISARSGRSVIQATLFTWMLAGPISNIFHHTTESIRSISCIAELQENQSKVMMNLIKAPILKGLGMAVDESKSLPKTQKEMDDQMKSLEVELLTSAFGKYQADNVIQGEEYNKNSRESMTEGIKNRRALHRRSRRNPKEEDVATFEDEFENETESIKTYPNLDVAGNMRFEARQVCYDIFDKAYDSCMEIALLQWKACMKIIPIPLFDKLICQLLWWKVKKPCRTKIADRKKSCRDNEPDFDGGTVNRNYTALIRGIADIENDFRMRMYWRAPALDEKSAVMTVTEITESVADDYMWKVTLMEISVSIARKFLAVTVILVLNASATYCSKYLTDINFDNFYVSSYFVHKDRERRRAKKRHLLPLTRLESKYVLRPTDFSLTVQEKKSVLFQVINLILRILFTFILFLFDAILFFVMDLVARHAKSDYKITGKHILRANIQGNGTVSDLMRIVFAGFLDNDHYVADQGSNEECMPKARALDPSYVNWTIAGFVLLTILIFVEGHLLRLRRVICGVFFPRREKRRIVHLYNNMLRQRKEQVFSVRKAVLKLALTKRLNQKYSFLEAIRIKYPRVGEVLSLCGYGKLHCLVCETPETARNPLWRCSNIKCRMLFCNVCWIEVDEMCWACNSDRGVEKALPEEELYAVESDLENIEQDIGVNRMDNDSTDFSEVEF